jgi:putative hydrolase of the HAD superfamily
MDHLYYMISEHMFIVKCKFYSSGKWMFFVVFASWSSTKQQKNTSVCPRTLVQLQGCDKGEMMTIRAVLFDFGGVLYRIPDQRWLRRWQILLGMGLDEDISALITSPEDSPYMQAILEGRISEDEVWERLRRRWRISPFLVRWLRRATMSRRRVNREMAAFLGALRPRYRTGILSNAGSDARRLFTDVFGFDRLVDTMVISAEEGIAKPDERIYHLALERLGVKADEAVFVDDMAVNVAAACQLGMQAIQFRETQQVLTTVRSFLE